MPFTRFHPASRRWFERQHNVPTQAQREAWAAIKSGRHTLISAPTGSGKTLAAFYAVIDDLVQTGLNQGLQDWVHVVYVSPLKALSNDIYHNLELPLDGIAEQLHLAAGPPVDIRMGVRTGDTSRYERQKMVRRPPHILVTTPESLYLLLTSSSGRHMLSGARTVIIDEIHAMLGDKRGSHLSLSLERLDRLAGGAVQRIGLSATQKPIDVVARYLVGNANVNDGAGNCVIIDSGHRRNLDISLEVPKSPLSALMSNEVWDELYERLVELIATHETTLVFVNTRRLSERLALALSERVGEDCVSAHHGSMSKEHRHGAEQRLKGGKLKVLVATASMELGIDIGSVDLVVQFSSPKSISTFLQRVGRSGHSIEGTPKGILFPLTRDDLVECAALIAGVRRGELDRLVVPESPIDILAQQIVAEVSTGSGDEGENGDGWSVGNLYKLFSNAWPYRSLTVEKFRSIIGMLADGYTSRRGRRGAHLHLDSINDRVRARRGSNLIALTNGGAIPDMFDYQVVLDPEDIVVGSLNEDFALEALPGDIFTLGSHSWQLLRIDGLKVRVRDAQGMAPTIPFWLGEGPGRTLELSAAVSDFRKTIAMLIRDQSLVDAKNWLLQEAGLQEAAAGQLLDYLAAGMEALQAMPSADTLVIERFFDEVGDMHVVLHAPFGSRVNKAWGLALRKRFCRTFNFELQAAANEDSIVISLGSVHSFPLDEVFDYLSAATLRDVLTQALLDAPMFEVRWRWNVTRALAIQRNRAGKRVPPQFQRMDAEDFVAHVFPDQIACIENLQGKREVPNHPLVEQTIQDCLTEAMDVETLTRIIGKIENGELDLVSRDLREPSPFAQEIINARPYAFLDDAPFEERRTNAIRNRRWIDPSESRDYSALDPDAIIRVKEEAWPFVSNVEEMHDAMMTLGYITASESKQHDYFEFARSLAQAGRACHVDTGAHEFWIAAERLVQMRQLFPNAAMRPEISLPASLRNRGWTPEEAAVEMIRGRLEGLGPVTSAALADESGLPLRKIEQALQQLELEGFVFQGRFTPPNPERQSEPLDAAGKSLTDGPLEWCERRLLQRIHRYTIDAHRRSIRPVSLQNFMRFLFRLHELTPMVETSGEATGGLEGAARLQHVMSLLDGVSAPAAAWEADILPSRVKNYDPAWLDLLCISGKIAWGRYNLAKNTKTRTRSSKAASPLKSTPVALLARSNQDVWQALVRASLEKEWQPELSPLAQGVEQDLQQSGASFFSDILGRTALLRSQLEQALAELVSAGKATSDSFTGLRALLMPAAKRHGTAWRGRKALFGVEDAGRWSLLQNEERAEVADGVRQCGLTQEQMERLVIVYLQRWGVIFRRLLEREMAAPAWRLLLPTLKRMELRGDVRGGRFIAGVGGEQFAFAQTVEALRRLAKVPEIAQLETEPEYVGLAASDPLNLLGLIAPESRLSRLARNRILFREGIPIAVLESGQVKFLREIDADQQWQIRQLLLKRSFPPRLRSYLGRQYH
ncbi:MAG: DEAD/DEAH box helicase [Pseudohongiellaceae bacterium]